MGKKIATTYHIEISPTNGSGCEFDDFIEAASIVDAFKQAKNIAKQLNEVNDKDCMFDVSLIEQNNIFSTTST